MTNFEKWKDEIAAIRSGGHSVAVVNGEPVKCISYCKSCDFKGCPCVGKLIDWFLAEYQEPAPKLTRREREFLECFNIMENKEIRRNYCGLSANYVFEKNNKITFAIDGKLFPFIKEGESWTFEDLLELEVKDDGSCDSCKFESTNPYFDPCFSCRHRYLSKYEPKAGEQE